MWKEVDRQRRLLIEGKTVVWVSLEESWAVLDEFYEGIVRREDRHGDTPFEAAMLCLELGFYPPPELLMTIRHQYQIYTYSGGKVSIEKSLFGPPRRKAGNHAQRHGSHGKLIHMAIQMAAFLKEGHTKLQVTCPGKFGPLAT